MSTIYVGAIITPTGLNSYDALPQGILAVSQSSGEIEWVEKDVPGSMVQEALARHGITSSDVDIVELRTGEFLMPGLIDTHTVCLPLCATIQLNIDCVA